MSHSIVHCFKVPAASEKFFSPPYVDPTLGKKVGGSPATRSKTVMPEIQIEEVIEEPIFIPPSVVR